VSDSAGYSGTPLIRKLGIKDEQRIAFLDAPADFSKTLGELPGSVELRAGARGKLDVIVFFVIRRRQLERRIETLGRSIHPNGGLWVAWPKRASGVATDMTEDVVREIALPLGLVDNKVCAIDETWSGLRVVWRKERR
jgi:hypothetical protein